MKMNFRKLPLAAAVIVGLSAGVSACSNNNHDNTPTANTPTAKLSDIEHVVVIYAENRSFDNLYGNFPGANGIPGLSSSSTGTLVTQKDRDGSTLSMLPPIWGGLSAGTTVDSAGGATASTLTQAETTGLPNKPFQIDSSNGFANGFNGKTVDYTVVTKDLYHRFYNNQMQIGPNGDNSSFPAWADAGGEVMGYYDGSKMALWNLVKTQGVLADNFFQAAFGGSFLNHQYLICACAPEYPNAATDPAAPAITQIDTGETGRQGIQGVALSVNKSGAAWKSSAIDGAAGANGGSFFVADNYVSPQVSIDANGKATYGAAGTWYGINTMQPPFQPSSNPPPATDMTYLTTDRSSAHHNTLPAQTKTTIGDALDAKNVTWAWYSGAWNQAVSVTTTSTHTTSSLSAANVSFQYHHQPFNYYSKLDPTTNAGYRAQHLKDYTDLTAAIDNGTLPEVAFYKPQGNLNQHPGYASVQEADDHIAALINRIMTSSYKNNTLVVVTYDENGGFWDHAKVPKGDWLGPGTRIPALIFGSFVKKGTVDHTQYDTASILRFLVKWKGLDATTYLPGLAMRDNALVANGNPKMGDLTAALNVQSQ
ncbi:MAG: acid phosphatase [Cupriavidus sp.]|nr:MAG: acid phosphatase [Cupriavidus sp.]